MEIESHWWCNDILISFLNCQAPYGFITYDPKSFIRPSASNTSRFEKLISEKPYTDFYYKVKHWDKSLKFGRLMFSGGLTIFDDKFEAQVQYGFITNTNN